ncbi:hypothetical protein ACFQ0K_05285 [Nocardioides caeni]|uniref:Uncharacterized protein n=1 Tax=Nocardioides caeni TaxID=574700 RepID=A0A4S8N7D0_9ACTN|nr:hypothetical protein [Nocardioides caeni]THV12108.1 hypothetical protein E9934_12200 [Nocardioides caeni]
MAALVVTGVTVALVVGSDATSVREVAERTAAAAEDLDVDAGIDLLCEPPTDEQRDVLDDMIAEGQDLAGTDDPELDVEVSEVTGDDEGSFHIEITSDDGDLDGREGAVTFLVGTDGDRSCIRGIRDTRVNGQGDVDLDEIDLDD